MRAVVQRSKHSQVSVNAVKIAEIDSGLVVLLGIKRADDRRTGENMMAKILNLRIFADAEGKMNRSLLEVRGAVLMISQFTLYGDARQGRRPSFIEAELPAPARRLFDHCVEYIKSQGINIQTGDFGADMLVNIENDGPCTILLDSERVFEILQKVN